MKKLTMEPLKIENLYPVTDFEKLNSLILEIKKNGFKNIPAIVVIETETGFYAITGSHRWEASAQLELDIPVELFQVDEIESIVNRDDVDLEGCKMMDRLFNTNFYYERS